jgi:hypothetical protein
MAAAAWLLALPAPSPAEFFRYVDRNGTVNFVDDPSRIPQEYRQGSRSYREPEDQMTVEQRAESRAQQQRDHEAREARRRDEAETQAREAYLKSLETPVTIRENQVLVPVRVGYGGREVELTLLLDTGAQQTLLYRHAVARLEIDRAERAVGQVAGGYRVQTWRVVLQSLRVGPWANRDMEVFLMDHVAPGAAEDGLLGMDFLAGRDYRIDRANQRIRWASPNGGE